MICPDCSAFLSNKAVDCTCGWKAAKGPAKVVRLALDCAFEGCQLPATVKKRVGPNNWSNVCEHHDIMIETQKAKAWAKEKGLDRQEGESIKEWHTRTLDYLKANRPPEKRPSPQACQERNCPITTRALPGKDFCRVHQEQFERDPMSVRRVGLLNRQPSEFKRAGDMLVGRQREPGDDDEEIPA